MRAYILARKDVSSNFYSWLGVLIFVFFYMLTGILFSLLMTSYVQISSEAVRNGYQGVEDIRMTHVIFGSFFLNLGVALIFMVPLLSMKTFSEERKQKTLELLFTYPLSDFDVVWGKFLGLLWFFALLLFPTLGYVFLFQWLGGALDWGPIISGYLGLCLLGAAFLALGLFISTLTDSQVTSALVTFGFLVLLWALEWIAGITDGKWSQFMHYLSPLSHYREFTFGIVDISHVAYFCFFCLYFLFLALRSIETRNWKG